MLLTGVNMNLAGSEQNLLLTTSSPHAEKSSRSERIGVFRLLILNLIWYHGQHVGQSFHTVLQFALKHLFQEEIKVGSQRYFHSALCV